MIEKITFIIAILSSALSIYGAILSTVLALKERCKLTLMYLGENYLSLSFDTIFSDKDRFDIHVFNKNSYTLAIFVRIVNKSKYPTTVNDFILNNKYFFNSQSEKGRFISTSFEYRDNYLTSKRSAGLDLIQPLITVTPYSTIEGYIVFSDIPSIPKKIKVSINTVQTTKSFKLRFPFTDYTKNIEQQ